MPFLGWIDGVLTVRPLQNSPADVQALARWLTDPAVLEFYEGRDNPHDEAKVRKVFFETLPQTQTACIVEWEGRPVGYVQFYPISADEYRDYGYDTSLRVYGMDQFIGEPAYWNRGIGSRMIRLVVAHLFALGADRVVMDPIAHNARAIRAYEKCGFRKVKLLPKRVLHEGVWQDVWLMEASPVSGAM